MAGAMRKMGIYLGLVEDDHRASDDGYETYGATARARSYTDDRRRDDYDDAEFAEAEYDDEPAPTPVTTMPRRTELAPSRSSAASARWSETPAASTGRSSYRITTLHPRTYNEARTIGEHFRDGVPVIINLSEMDDSDAKRLVDFAAGLTFGLHGSIERVTNKVFLLSPQKVQVTAEDKARIAEGGFFNQS
ncbi:cell division inhibitor SepF [Antricoccus suffuscus]|uniref:Cell division protein SepF n=1 Tax=Antricoccus suffuscus TaxID=1629062 RepID=A0A2T0ZYJ0_9ACTN|nr:cell division protein SepF [Antricoccus suffuscus]PRZ41422.1 cell division inhibitor SepF [Antricoccus suffuscus]